jgi:hypothetical protein
MYPTIDHKQRHRDRGWQVCWAMGTYKLKKCAVRKIIFCNGLTRVDRARQKSFVPARRVQRTTKDGPTHFHSLSPYSPQFQQSAGAPPLSCLSDHKYRSVRTYLGRLALRHVPWQRQPAQQPASGPHSSPRYFLIKGTES